MVHGCLNGAAVSRPFIQGYNTFYLSRIDPNKDVMHHMLLDLTKARRDHAWYIKRKFIVKGRWWPMTASNLQ